VREESDVELALRGTLALDLKERRLSRLIEFLDPTARTACTPASRDGAT